MNERNANTALKVRHNNVKNKIKEYNEVSLFKTFEIWGINGSTAGCNMRSDLFEGLSGFHMII